MKSVVNNKQKEEQKEEFNTENQEKPINFENI